MPGSAGHPWSYHNQEGHPSLRNDLETKRSEVTTITRNNIIITILRLFLHTSPYNLYPPWTDVESNNVHQAHCRSLPLTDVTTSLKAPPKTHLWRLFADFVGPMPTVTQGRLCLLQLTRLI